MEVITSGKASVKSVFTREDAPSAPSWATDRPKLVHLAHRRPLRQPHTRPPAWCPRPRRPPCPPLPRPPLVPTQCYWFADAFPDAFPRPSSHTPATLARWSGLMRGAVSVALVYFYFDARTDGHHATVITSTLLVVLFTTVAFGAVTKPLLFLLLEERPDDPLMQLIADQMAKLRLWLER
eukprot:352715-Chlamydomonas_euryale.AAC.3